jgi:hypothetical protein
MAGGVAQVVEYLTSKLEAMSSNPMTACIYIYIYIYIVANIHIYMYCPYKVLNMPRFEIQPLKKSLGFHPFQVCTGHGRAFSSYW